MWAIFWYNKKITDIKIRKKLSRKRNGRTFSFDLRRTEKNEKGRISYFKRIRKNINYKLTD
jgi:hypothetical protein